MPKYGDIVIVADVLDPNGRNPKNRACVVVTPSEEIEVGGPLDVVAITSLVPDPLRGDQVPLPWHAQRRATSPTWRSAHGTSRLRTPGSYAPSAACPTGKCSGSHQSCERFSIRTNPRNRRAIFARGSADLPARSYRQIREIVCSAIPLSEECKGARRRLLSRAWLRFSRAVTAEVGFVWEYRDFSLITTLLSCGTT